MLPTTPEHLKALSEKLSNAARKGRLNQSVLFVGREGIGKFSLVLNLAQTLLCQKDMSACGQCQSCQALTRIAHPDFLLLFPFPNLKPESKKFNVFPFSDPVQSSARFSEETRDAVDEIKQGLLEDPFKLSDSEKKDNIPVDVVKDLIYALAKRPFWSGRRVVGVLDIDKMAYGAADLFLKTVEEPPANTHILLTTSRPDLLYPTLLSRTQRIKVPPVPENNVETILKDRLGLKPKEALYLARLSNGSPGLAIHLSEHEIIARREVILDLFLRLLSGEKVGKIVDDIVKAFGGFKYRFDDIRIDFDIIESIIHDLYMIGENRLDNHFINIDIRVKFDAIKAPQREVLDIWNGCCARTRQATTVNNVAADSAMIFFYISCAEALDDLSRPRYTLP